MNVSELARQLSTTTTELYHLLPQFGFDIGRKAVKVDDRVAYKIIAAWPPLYRKWQDEQKAKYSLNANEILKAQAAGAEAEKKVVPVPPAITVRDFASRLNLPVTTVIRELLKNGILASLNERIDYETANIIGGDLGVKIEPEAEKKDEEIDNTSLDRLKDILDSEDKKNLEPRPPVVVVMGHVDHGKTRLLDAIRKTNVMGGEAGGITQHIGAYQVMVPFKNETQDKIENRSLTFIDTPGHEAFTVMRSRGAKVADIAILVVAADDGVQPQTKEAVKIIEAAKLPFLVALNKIDKPEADVDRVKSQLSEIGLQAEEWGGKTVIVPISAKAGMHIDKLLEMVLLLADIDKEKIVSNPNRRAVGTIVESHIDPQAGPVATLLVQSGTLRVGENLAINFALYGRVKALKNWKGEFVKLAPPSMPVQILGFKVAPAVGDILEVPESVKGLEKKLKPSYLVQEKSVITQPIQVAAGEEAVAKKKYSIIIRADVLGSLEAILGALERMIHPEVGVEVMSKGLGSVTDAEILRAAATSAHILGFHVPIAPKAELLAKQKGVVIKHYKIIYDLLGDVKKELEKLLPPEVLREELGKIEVLAIFRTEKKYQIVGGRVSEGRAENNVKARIMRNGEQVGSGEVVELQAGRQKVKDALAGQECGLKLQTKDAVEVGDKIELYREEIKERKLGF